jgi:predicted RNase H-like HicB family nuclease
MSQFDYGFSIELKENTYYQLVFLDIPNLIITDKTRDAIFQKAQDILDDYLYSLLKSGKKIPLPKTKVPHDKRISPSQAIQDALSFIII